MFGLILKDFYNIRKQAVWYAAMIVLFCVLTAAVRNVAYGMSMAVLVSVSVPLTATAYEEKDGWQKFVIASGMDTRTIVIEKYLLGLLVSLVGAAAYLIAFLISEGYVSGWIYFVAPVCLQCVALSVVLPLVFKFGVEKARTYMIIIVVAFMVIAVGLMGLWKSDINPIAKRDWILSLSFSAVAAVALLLSLYLSIKIYRHKEF